MLPISPDVIGGLAPDKGLRHCVVQQEVVVDRAFEIVDAGVAAMSDAFHGDLGEEALHGVQPGRAGWREVQLEARMFLQPGPHLGRLVGGIVVEDDVDVARLSDCAVNAAQECQELLGPMARHAVANDEARRV